jgi:acyl-homoserine lactone acylase PvdQ
VVSYGADNRPTARYVLLGGQSGIPDSRHFNDQQQDWLQGKLRSLPYTRADVLTSSESKTTLR